MTGVMIVRKRKDFSNAFVEDESPQHHNPTLEIVLPVDHRLIPGRRLFLDAFTISEPTDVSKVSVNPEIEQRAAHVLKIKNLKPLVSGQASKGTAQRTLHSLSKNV